MSWLFSRTALLTAIAAALSSRVVISCSRASTIVTPARTMDSRSPPTAKANEIRVRSPTEERGFEWAVMSISGLKFVPHATHSNDKPWISRIRFDLCSKSTNMNVH